MIVTYEKCCAAAKIASEVSEYYEFRCNRRKGYIALDRYSKDDGTCYDPLICGTAREVLNYINGGLYLGFYLYKI